MYQRLHKIILRIMFPLVCGLVVVESKLVAMGSSMFLRANERYSYMSWNIIVFKIAVQIPIEN